MIFIRQGFTNRSRKVDECMIHMIAEARHTEGQSRLETVFFDSAEARGSTKPQGRKPIRRAGVPGNVKIPDTHKSFRTYGFDNYNASKAGTDNAQAWFRTKILRGTKFKTRVYSESSSQRRKLQFVTSAGKNKAGACHLL